MTLREQMENQNVTLDQKIIDACGRIRDRDDAIQVCRQAVLAERERCARILRKTASLMAGPTRSPP